MFDEMDEGTAIFKCTSDVPVGRVSQLVTYEGLPGDYYLKLVGAGTRMLRGEIPPTKLPPGLETLADKPSSAGDAADANPGITGVK